MVLGFVCAQLGYNRVKHDWFKQFLELPNGIPSHDTFGRIFAMIAPDQFQKAFSQK